MELCVVHCAMDEVRARRDAAAGGHGALYARTLALLEDAGFPDCVLRYAHVMLREAREEEKRAYIESI